MLKFDLRNYDDEANVDLTAVAKLIQKRYAYKIKRLILRNAVQPHGGKRRNQNILRTKILDLDKRSGSIVRSNVKGHV
jgi:hypothetical protein